MAAALKALDLSMDRALVYRHGDPVQVVAELAAEVGASEVYVTRDHAPYGRRRDAEVGAALSESGRRLVGVGANYAVAPGTVTKADGTPYAVFTPFSKAWRAHGWAAPLEVPDVEWMGAPTVRCDGPPAPVQVELDLGWEIGRAHV